MWKLYFIDSLLIFTLTSRPSRRTRWDPPYASGSGLEIGLEHGCCMYYRDSTVPAPEVSEEDRAKYLKQVQVRRITILSLSGACSSYVH